MLTVFPCYKSSIGQREIEPIPASSVQDPILGKDMGLSPLLTYLRVSRPSFGGKNIDWPTRVLISFLFHPLLQMVLWRVTMGGGSLGGILVHWSEAWAKGAGPRAPHHLLSWVTLAFGADRCHLGKKPCRFPA